MDWTYLLALLIIGLSVSVFSGLLGIGGAIIVIPALYYLPPLFGLPGMDMLTVSALSMVQVLVTAISGGIAHSKNKFVSKPVVQYIGISILVTSFIGAYLSKFANNQILLYLFAGLCLVASIVMLLPKKNIDADVSPEKVSFNKPLAVIGSGMIGLLAGLVGMGGGFILSPFMLNILGIPTRITVGSSLFIILLSASAGFIGKLAAGYINWPYAVALAIGAVPGAQIGAKLSHLLKAKTLRHLLAAAIYLMAFKIWLEVAPLTWALAIFVGVPIVVLGIRSLIASRKTIADKNC